MDKIFFIGIGVVLLVVGFVLLVKPNAIPAVQVKEFIFPVGVVLLILGLAAAAYPFSPYFKPSTPGPINSSGVAGSSQTPTASATPSLPATVTPVPIAITSPTNGAGVRSGFTVSGTAPDLGEDKLWLFVWGDNATVPGKVYYRTTSVPIGIVSGFWDAHLGSLGAPGKEIGRTFILRLVRANPHCSDVIKNITPSPMGNFFIRELPNGCTEVAPPLYVTKEA